MSYVSNAGTTQTLRYYSHNTGYIWENWTTFCILGEICDLYYPVRSDMSIWGKIRLYSLTFSFPYFLNNYPIHYPDEKNHVILYLNLTWFLKVPSPSPKKCKFRGASQGVPGPKKNDFRETIFFFFLPNNQKKLNFDGGLPECVST